MSEEQRRPEPEKLSCGKAKHQTLFCRLTLELSRPVSGRRTCASVAQSTWPMPRHGVGLNELLGGGGCRYKLGPSELAESRSGRSRARTRELSAGCNRSDRVSVGRLTTANHCSRSRPTPRMRCMSAPDELDRSSNAAGNIPKSNANRSRQSHRVEKQSHQTLFCRLTLELSRTTAGWRQRAA